MSEELNALADILYDCGWASPNDAQWGSLNAAIPAIRELLSRPAPASAPVPEGMVLVPLVPTPAMLSAIAFSEWPADWDAGKKMQRELGSDAVYPKTEVELAVGQYQRMLAAAPAAPAAYDLASGNDYSATWDVSKAAPAARESGAQECMTHGAAVHVVPKAMYDQLMSNYIALSKKPVAQGGGVDAEKVMALVEEYGSAMGRCGLGHYDAVKAADALLAQIRAMLTPPAIANQEEGKV